MIELLSTYSSGEIIVFVFMLLIALKEILELFKYFNNILKKQYKKSSAQNEQMQEVLTEIKEIKKDIGELKKEFDKNDRKLETLIESDKDSIKAFIVEKHHTHVGRLKWIDDYTMDVLEKRYVHYKDEGGNSYAAHLMADLRELPKNPPEEEEE